MSNWLIHNENIIINAIVADSKEIAEEATGYKAFPASEDAKPWINWIKYNDSWIPPKPEGEWQWNEEYEKWIPLMPQTGTLWTWNNDLEQWEETPS